MTREQAEDILGIAPGASRSEIVAAYRQQIADYHPDRVATLPSEFQRIAHEKMTELNAAYAFINQIINSA